MSTSNRAARLKETHRILKKHYKPVPPADRTLLEHLLYACCLENSPYEQADEAFARLQQAYFDWNEVRVTTVTELSEVMGRLPRATAAASHLKRSLQAMFECYYSFDIEALKKENIGKAVKQLEKLDGVSPFAIAYVTQNGLGGHAIPVTAGALAALHVLGVVSEKEAKTHRVPGLERAIAKNKGIEFGSLLHQLGIDFEASPFSPRVRRILLEITPDAKERLPKRAAKKASGEKKSRDKEGAKVSSTRAKKTPSAKKPAATGRKSRKGSSKKTAESPKTKSTSSSLSKKKPR